MLQDCTWFFSWFYFCDMVNLKCRENPHDVFVNKYNVHIKTSLEILQSNVFYAMFTYNYCYVFTSLNLQLFNRGYVEVVVFIAPVRNFYKFQFWILIISSLSLKNWKLHVHMQLENKFVIQWIACCKV